jgi:hypothetical protein
MALAVPIVFPGAYAVVVGWKKQVYNTGLLTEEAHKRVIGWTGRKNSRSTGASISVDTFDALGILDDLAP